MTGPGVGRCGVACSAMRQRLGTGLGRASRCVCGGPRPRRALAGTGRRTRGSPRPDMEFRLAAGRPDTGGVGDILVAEDLGRAGVDVGGRQAREVVGHRGGDMAGHPLVPEVAEHRAPAELVHLTGPDTGIAGILAARGGGVAVVEHGADEHLGGDRQGAAVACHQGDPGGEATAGAGARHDDAGGVDAQLVGVLGDPQQPPVAVVDQSRATDFGRQPVVHGDHDGTEQVEPLQRDVDLREAISHDHPTAVYPEDARCPCGVRGPGGAEDRQGNPRTVLARHGDLAPVDRATFE